MKTHWCSLILQNGISIQYNITYVIPWQSVVKLQHSKRAGEETAQQHYEHKLKVSSYYLFTCIILILSNYIIIHFSFSTTTVYNTILFYNACLQNYLQLAMYYLPLSTHFTIYKKYPAFLRRKLLWPSWGSMSFKVDDWRSPEIRWLWIFTHKRY